MRKNSSQGVLSSGKPFPVLKQLQPGSIRTQKSYKYCYLIEDNSWYSTECRVRIAERPFAEGGMRWCVMVKLESQDEDGGRAVVKVFKPDVIPKKMEEKAYFHEAMTQTIAESYAKVFNARCSALVGRHVKISFLPCNLEPLLEDGNVETKEEVPQAFSHFTWQASEGRILVCDIQGVGTFYTDPQIHSFDGKAFGAGNLGMAGIKRFFSTHVCNSICKKLGLQKPRPEQQDWRVRDSSQDAGGDFRILKDWSASRYDGAYSNFKSTARKSMELSKSAAEEIRKQFAEIGDCAKSERRLSRSVSESQLDLLAEEANRLALKADSCLGDTCRDALQEMSNMLRLLKEKEQRDMMNRGRARSDSLKSSGSNGSQRNEKPEGECVCKFCGVSGTLSVVISLGLHHAETCSRRGNEALSNVEGLVEHWV